MTSTPTRPVDNVVIATKALQDRNTNVTAGTTVENEGKLILTVVENKETKDEILEKWQYCNRQFQVTVQF